MYVKLCRCVSSQQYVYETQQVCFTVLREAEVIEGMQQQKRKNTCSDAIPTSQALKVNGTRVQ
jgi:hypothetical protein